MLNGATCFQECDSDAYAGANIGLFTLQLLLAAPAPGVIIAVEPMPPNLAQLRRNLALHAADIARSGCVVRCTFCCSDQHISVHHPPTDASLQLSI